MISYEDLQQIFHYNIITANCLNPYMHPAYHIIKEKANKSDYNYLSPQFYNLISSFITDNFQDEEEEQQQHENTCQFNDLINTQYNQPQIFDGEVVINVFRNGKFNKKTYKVDSIYIDKDKIINFISQLLNSTYT